jgi:hypothetical protein
MSRDKKIDSMTKDLCHTETCEIKKIGIPCNHRCKAHIYATRAIDKGYAKASEVAGEFIEAVDKMMELVVAMTGCSFTYFGKYAELKKKYIGEDINVRTNTEET